MMPAIIPEGRRRPYEQAKDVPVNTWKRIKEFETCLHGKVFDSDTGRRRCALALDHYAWLPDGSQRMDAFLDAKADWMSPDERERLKNAALAGMRTYGAAEAGKIVGLTWAFRCKHDIRTMRAIDTPPADVRDAQRRKRAATSKRAGRASNRGPISASKQRALDLQRRRLAAIHDALSEGAMSVADLCRVLGKARNGAFNMVSKQDLPRVVRRVIKQDPSLRTETRAVEGRPDLRPSMWVMRKTSTTEEEKKAVIKPNRQPRSLAGPTREVPPPERCALTRDWRREATPACDQTPAAAHKPDRAAEYVAHVRSKLRSTRPGKAGALAALQWFKSPEEVALREQSGLTREQLRHVMDMVELRLGEW